MKTEYFTVLVSLLLPFGALAQGTLMFNAGESYTFEFTSPPLVGPASPDAPFLQYGSMSGFFSTAPAGSSMLWEMFENSTSESPIASQIVSPPTTTLPNPPPLYAFAGWADLQGVIRISMLSGSTTTDTLRAAFVRRVEATPFEYSTVIPIREPNSLALVGVGLVAFCVTKQKRKAGLR